MECPHAHVSVRLPPGCVCRRHVKKEACAFGVLSSSRPAALWPFLSPAAGEEGGLQQGSPPVPLSAGLCAGCHHHPRGRGGDPMLPAGQRSQLPGLQPAHSERSASGHPAWAAGLQLNQRSLTVREQSSRPRAGRMCGRHVVGQSLSCWEQGGQHVTWGLGSRGLHPQVARSSEKLSCRLADMRLINLDLNSVLSECSAG